MNKSKQDNTIYKQISYNESVLLSLIKSHNLTVVNTKELYSLSNWNKNRIHNTLFSLTNKKVLTRIKRNLYTLTENINEKLFEIATEINTPAYISFWSALSYYGFTEQQIHTIQLVSIKQIKKINLNSHTINVTTYNPTKFFGYKKINNFVIAEKEKTLIDSLFQLDKCGGLNEYVKCLNFAWDEINKKKFLEYLKKFQNKTLISRLGFIVEKLELKNTHVIETLKKYRSLSPVKLNPYKPRKGEHNKKWNVLINDIIILEKIK